MIFYTTSDRNKELDIMGNKDKQTVVGLVSGKLISFVLLLPPVINWKLPESVAMVIWSKRIDLNLKTCLIWDD